MFDRINFYMRKALLILCVFIGNYSIGQTTYIYTGTGTWQDLENWNLNPNNINNDDFVIVSAGSTLTLLGGHQNHATFTNNGTVNVPEDKILSNLSYGIINNAGIINSSGRINNGSGTFNNLMTGIINIESNSDFYNQNNPETIINNYGTINIDGVLYNLNNRTINNDGNIIIQSSGRINNEGEFNNNIDGVLTNNGIILHYSNNIFNYGVINNNSAINFLNFSSFTSGASGIINNFINGYIENGPFATVTNHGDFNNIGLFYDYSVASSTISIANFGTINNTGEVRSSYSSIFSNEVTGIINNDALFFNIGNLSNSGIINNDITGTLYNDRDVNNYDSGVINNDGIIENVYFSTINNNGLGVLNNNTSGFILNTGEFNGLLNSWGDLRGTNTLHTTSFISNGSVTPGDVSLVGLYQFTDDYSQNTNAELNIEIEDELIFDKISVGGDCNLGGTLRVTLLNEFDPIAGNSYTIITANEVFGSFNTLDLPVLIDKEWIITYNSDSVVLSIENSLSLNEHESLDNIKLFPNPVKDQLTIDSKQIINLIRVYDINGRIVKEVDYDNVYILNLDVGSLENGFYFINVNNMTYKFIKR